MTEQEAIEELSGMYRICVVDSLNGKIEAKNKNNAIDMAIEALEKQIPKFVICKSGWQGTRYTRYQCPNCNRTLRMNEEWCNDCGQHIKQPKVKKVDDHFELDWSEN